MFRIIPLVALFAVFFQVEARAEEPSSFVLVKFPVPEGWKRFESGRPKTVCLLLHGGKTVEEADGIIQLDVGHPAFKTPLEFAESIAVKDGTVDPKPFKLAGVEAFRVTTPSKDFARPNVAIIAYHEDHVFFLAAAAKPDFDVEPAVKAILESWQWRETDSTRLTGEWKIERVEAGGNEITGVGFPTEMVFRDGVLTFSVEGKSTPSMKDLIVAVNTKEKPAHLDLIRELREELPCIYEVTEDRLTIAMPAIPKSKKPEDRLPRPTGLDSSKEPIVVMFAKRVPKKDEPPKASEK